MEKSIKLSEYAKLMSVHYQTAHHWWELGKIEGAYMTPSGSVMVRLPKELESTPSTANIVIYARVSSHPKKADLDRQVQRCLDYCAAKGYSVAKVYKEIASGMNDKRPKLWSMLNSSPTLIVVEHKDRLTRFGFMYLDKLLEKLNCKIEVINQASGDEEDIIKDMISIVTSFCCRLYGSRCGQNKAKVIKETLDDPSI